MERMIALVAIYLIRFEIWNQVKFYFSIRVIVGTGTQNQSLDVVPIGVSIFSQLPEGRSGMEFLLAKNVLEYLQNHLDETCR